MKKGILQHWLYGEREYNVLVTKNTNCGNCIHNEVCNKNTVLRCVNYIGGCSSSDGGCWTCIQHFAKFDEKQPIPCFYCKSFKSEANSVDDKITNIKLAI